MRLNELKIGEYGRIKAVNGDGALRRHLLDMGVIPGVCVRFEKLAPMGDPMEIRLRGYELTVRVSEAENIEIEKTEEPESDGADAVKKQSEHPGLGEGGRFHAKGDGDPLPEGSTLSFALVGNQNCGKTTLFNVLTGSNQHVGNFPGVTIDRKDGSIKGHNDTVVTDLPGVYSMSPYTPEEIVSRDFILKQNPGAIINILDATNIERNLYLTMQLLEMNVPMVVALNMMDEMTGNGGSVDINVMENMLGVPVVPISASKEKGIDELIDHAIHICHYREKPIEADYCDSDTHGAVHRCIHGVEHLIEDHAKSAGLPLRFSAVKIIEGDKIILDELKLDENEKEMIEHIVTQMENEHGLDRVAAMADMRFTFIEKVCRASVVKPKESREHVRSKKIDKILTGKFTAIPVFILIMVGVFILTFNVVGAFLQNLLETGINYVTGLADTGLTEIGVNETIHGFIIDGLFKGVGSVLSFLPLIVTLFFFLSIMEDSGYIARVAFVMDKLLRKIGLSGRSIVPMLIGFGCTVPAVMATRTLPSERDRKMTILLTPLMSCTAKLPVFVFFVDAFFPSHKGLIMAGLYVLSIIIGILVALIFKSFMFRGEAVPFVMELPNYRLPGLKNVAQLIWEKAKDFLRKAFTVILVASAVIWFLQSFDIHLNFVTNRSESILALISGFISPIFAPLGLNDWRITTSLISGFMAKESVVSSMGVLFGTSLCTALSTASAGAMLVFCLLYTPCAAAVASIKRELGWKYAAFVIAWQCLIAWVFGALTYLVLTVI